MLIDPPEAVTAKIGTRPQRLADRERWLVAAARLIGDERLELTPSADREMLDDTGLEL